MLEQTEIEGVAESIYRAAGLKAGTRVRPERLASAILGAGTVRVVGDDVLPRHHAAVARIRDEWRIYLRRGLAPSVRNFSIAHELAEWVLVQRGAEGTEVEQDADGVAAALLAPRCFAERACRASGRNWEQLALAFNTSQSFAVLRYGEVTGYPLALVTRSSVRERGAPAPWPTNAELRSPEPCPGIVRAVLRDDASRFVVQRAN